MKTAVYPDGYRLSSQYFFIVQVRVSAVDTFDKAEHFGRQKFDLKEIDLEVYKPQSDDIPLEDEDTHFKLQIKPKDDEEDALSQDEMHYRLMMDQRKMIEGRKDIKIEH